MEPEPDAPPAAFGPFHRLESPTQTPEDARQQEESGEIWGRAPRGRPWPAVKAFRGSLGDGQRGVEFYTNVSPDAPNRGQNYWTPAFNEGVRLEDGYAKIDCVIVKNTQTEGGSHG
jgi:hypothetical protein